MLCITCCIQISMSMVMQFDDNDNFFILLVDLMYLWQIPTMVRIVIDISLAGLVWNAESLKVITCSVNMQAQSYSFFLSGFSLWHPNYLDPTDMYLKPFEGVEIVNLYDVRLFHIHWKKSDSTNDRSEGYLYYTCSQSSSLSIHTCILGISQICQFKYGPFCGLLAFVLLCSLSFMISRRSRVGQFDFRAVYKILVLVF